MKKFTLTLLFYGVIGLVFYGCCRERHRLIGSQELNVQGAIAWDSVSLMPIISGQFSLYDNHLFETASTDFASFGLQTAYAFQPCPLDIVNPVDSELLELYFDQQLELEGVSLPASTNILADTTFRNHMIVFENFDTGNSSIEISLDSSFFDPPIFADGPMNIRLVTRLEDGDSFENDIDVIVDMQ